MRISSEKEAEEWYTDLKQTSYKYIALYKERIDSLLYYQRKLNQIVDAYLKPMPNMIYTDTVIRAISGLHRIEISIFNLWKQLPELDIVEKPKEKEEEVSNEIPPMLDEVDLNGVEEIPEKDGSTWHAWLRCEICNRYWQGEQLLNYHKKTTHHHHDSTISKQDYHV